MSRTWVTIVFLFILVGSGAQSIDRLQIVQQYDAYRAMWSKTYVHLVFNQNKYSPGDTVWFKAYFLNEDLTGVSGKQLIELNLVDSAGASKLHLLFSVVDGVGHNQLVIPDELPAGVYIITAYSSWMKNFDPPLFFIKRMPIVVKNEVIVAEAKSLQAVPEGGHLIYGIPCKVGIHSNRKNAAIQLVDAEGVDVGSTITDSNGVGAIIFTPLKKSYFAQIVGDTTQTALPLTEEDGCSLVLKPSTDTEPAKIRITSPEGSPLRNQELRIIVSSLSKIQFTQMLPPTTGGIVEALLPADLPPGVLQVSLLNQRGDLLASRDFYNDEVPMVKPTILTSKQIYKPREKISMEVILTDQAGKPVIGEFSIKVLNSSLFNLDENLLADDLIILTREPRDFHINRSDSTWQTSLDNLLLVTTNPIPWKEILSGKLPTPRFPFSSVIEKTGTAYTNDPPVPVPDLTQILFYLQKNQMIYQTFTLADGKVGLTIPDIFEPDEFFYMAQTRGKDVLNFKIRWDESTIQLPKAPHFREANEDVYASFATKRKLIERSFGAYGNQQAEGRISNNLMIHSFEDEINGVDIVVKIQDFNSFTTMEEMIKEVVPSMYHRKAGKKSIVRVSLQQPMAPASKDPLYIIDGIATTNTDFFLSLKPADLVTLKIVNKPKKLIPLGLMGKNGIVMVQTKNGNVREPLNGASKLVQGISRPLSFKAQNQKSTQPNHPDFRSTLYWNPGITTNAYGKATIEFYGSDDVGELQIRIDGFTSDGEPFSATHKARVVTDLETN